MVWLLHVFGEILFCPGALAMKCVSSLLAFMDVRRKIVLHRCSGAEGYVCVVLLLCIFRGHCVVVYKASWSRVCVFVRILRI